MVCGTGPGTGGRARGMDGRLRAGPRGGPTGRAEAEAVAGGVARNVLPGRSDQSVVAVVAVVEDAAPAGGRVVEEDEGQPGEVQP